MTRTLLGALALTLIVAGCGRVADSRINPLNWFGNDRSERVEAAEGTRALPARDDTLIAQVTSLTVSPTPSGAIISAIGLPPTQGFWQAELLQVPSDDPATLVYEFRIKPPQEAAPAGAQASREVLVGGFVSTQDLNGVRAIVVTGTQNRRSVRRR